MMCNKIIVPLIVIYILSLSFTSCINENLNDCDVDVSFIHNYNLSGNDVLDKEADKGTLYIFNKEGLLLYTYFLDMSNLNKNIISVLKLAQGDYKFVATAQSSRVDNNLCNFEKPDLVVGQSTISDLLFRMKRKNGIQDSELNNFFLGNEDIKYTGESHLQLSLKRVTKKISLILNSTLDNVNLDASNFEISLVDELGNGLVNYDFSLLKDESITYKPYSFLNLNETTESKSNSVGFYMNTSRLLVKNNPILKVKDLLNKKSVLDISLIKLLQSLQIESGYSKLDLQDYLDRLDEAEIRIPVDTNFGSIVTTIYINGWTINLDKIDL